MDRRAFIKVGALAGVGLALDEVRSEESAGKKKTIGAQVLSTHSAGIAANTEALRVLERGGSAVDAAQLGVMVVEADPDNTSVGYGGYPNAEGVVELDAAIMDGDRLEAGSVAALRNIMHPVAVARLVMDETPHVMLVGEGARKFAMAQGFLEQDLLTTESRARWKERKKSMEAGLNHDTIGMIVRAADGSMAASCTTSGLAWKLPGRVGDSPLIAHGLYCDSKAGGATATGIGEEIIKVCGSYQIVEFMRQGLSPDEAIRRVIHRALRRKPANSEQLIAFVAMRADGEIGYGSTNDLFQASIYRKGKHVLKDAPRIGLPG